MRYRLRGAWLALLAFIADRVSKIAVVNGFEGELIPGILRSRPVGNRGMAFSMLSSHPWLLTLVTTLILTGIALWLILRPGESGLIRMGFWLVVGGGIGNLFDRVTCGYVIDFLDLEFVRFAIFNLADVCVCVGAGLTFIGMLSGDKIS